MFKFIILWCVLVLSINYIQLSKKIFNRHLSDSIELTNFTFNIISTI